MTATPAYAPTGQTLPVGATCETSAIYAVRTPKQLTTVLDIAARDGFAFAGNNPFSEETADHFTASGRNYTGPFWFLWHDISGELHATRIGKSGILREIAGSEAAAH